MPRSASFLNFPDESYFKKVATQEIEQNKEELTHNADQDIKFESDYTQCPRGFGNIKKLDDDNSVSDKCLGCFRIMQCYGEDDNNFF